MTAKWIMASSGFCLARITPSIVHNGANKGQWQTETVLCMEQPFNFFVVVVGY